MIDKLDEETEGTGIRSSAALQMGREIRWRNGLPLGNGTNPRSMVYTGETRRQTVICFKGILRIEITDESRTLP